MLDRTPFYGEIGGQVGDTGKLEAKSFVLDVTDTQRDGDLVVHIGRLKSGKITVGDEASAVIDAEPPRGIRRAHSATHILHHALQTVLGPNAMQRGSKVEDDVLRFDFAHKQAMTPAEVIAVEREINARIADGATVKTDVVDIKTARERGAKRALRREVSGHGPDGVDGGLQPGTVRRNAPFQHRTGRPDPRHLRGARRGRCPPDRCLHGEKAIESVREQDNLIKQLQQQLRAGLPSELPAKVTQLQEELREVKQELSSTRSSRWRSSRRSCSPPPRSSTA